jgi:hypothetical protein
MGVCRYVCGVRGSVCVCGMWYSVVHSVCMGEWGIEVCGIYVEGVWWYA